MSARREQTRLTLDLRSLPILLLTLAFVSNFFWRAQLFGGVFTGNNVPPVVVAAMLLVGLWFLHGLGVTGTLQLRVPRVFWPMALYVFAVILSIVVRADFASRSLQHALRLLTLLLLMLLVSNLARSLGTLESSLYVLVAGLTAAALYALADFVISGRYYLNLFRGIENKNSSAYHLMIGVLFALFCARSPHIPRLGRRLVTVAGLILFAAMLLALARSAVIGLVTGLGMVWVLYARRIDKRAVALIVLVAAASFVAAPERVKDKLGTTFDFQERQGQSNSSRIILLRAGLRAAADHPLVGLGIGRFDENLDQYVTPAEKARLGFATYEAAHNQYVIVMNEAGILGLVALLWLLWEVLRGLHRRLKRPDLPRRYLVLAFAAFWWGQAVHFFIEWQLPREVFWYMVGLTGALLYLTAEDETPVPDERNSLVRTERA